MTDEEFKMKMLEHMKTQTDLLQLISDGMKTVRIVGKTISAIIAILFGWFAISDYFGLRHK